ncbi:MAG: hypothetical protein ACI8QZ_002402 [Chlamydiales bacterium]|jgi:hypothetical protein
MATSDPRGLRAGLLFLLLVFVLNTTSGCAGLNSERHLAPLITTLSLAGGDRETEALGGIYLNRTSGETDRTNYWAMRPIFSSRDLGDEKTVRWFLPPLGRFTDSPGNRVWQFLPIMRYAAKTHPDGRHSWTFFTLPGIYWAKTLDERIIRAWFPIAGVVEHFLSFDRASFFLWPLYSRVEQHGRTSIHVLWPIFKWSWGRGGKSWRVWPLIGNKRWDDRYSKWFFLWPVFIWQTDKLKQPDDKQVKSWGVFPLFARRTRGEASSYSVLWPFFGWGHDPETGAWAWDGPWPFVRILDPGDTDGPRRVRFWPLYSKYEGDGLSSTYYLFPIVNRRKEEMANGKRSTTSVLPFWQNWTRTYTGSDDVRSFKKLWPLWRMGRDDSQGTYYAWPALNPLWRTPIIDEHYAWLWEVYASVRKPGIKRERSLLALWRRESDPDEDRRSFVGLWSRRKYSQAGKRVVETSYLFGLLRFRSRADEGIEWMAPALPGPGWPLERVPNSILPPRPTPE